MAEGVLAPYPAARRRMGERAFGELMAWLDGHPLSLRLTLPHLESMSPAALLEALAAMQWSFPRAPRRRATGYSRWARR